jgi:hypothetical protein
MPHIYQSDSRIPIVLLPETINMSSRLLFSHFALKLEKVTVSEMLAKQLPSTQCHRPQMEARLEI